MVEFLEAMPFWGWFVFAAILLIVEISTGSTYFLWPAAAAVVVGFTDLWPLDGAWRAQLAVFGVLTVLLTIFATPKVKPWLHKSQADHLTLNERGAQKIGKRVRVEEAFSSGVGRVRFGDTVWLAGGVDGANFEKGAEVEIVSVDGAKLYVKGV
ncbi:MAG: NfeD family protein [Parvularculaceae bacterium]|nr:NfeD family protein [Parvularculaceae bacterium]